MFPEFNKIFCWLSQHQFLWLFSTCRLWYGCNVKFIFRMKKTIKSHWTHWAMRIHTHTNHSPYTESPSQAQLDHAFSNIYRHRHCFCFVLFLWDWGLNSGLHISKTGTLLLELHLQSIFLWLFWRWSLAIYLPWLGLHHDTPDLSLPSSLDYRHEP
jgi:hypothetical protein